MSIADPWLAWNVAAHRHDANAIRVVWGHANSLSGLKATFEVAFGRSGICQFASKASQGDHA
jgi:hypothetical protein